ncbi:MAG: ATP-dependent Clp protease ATP-binding subunit, partial [Chloroflexi bacterium]|nr:ATP-dependent Clp protease ATP-binding subunit [Chloroflexota bacterium]
TEAVRRHPYRVVLFDEIEKAHPEVLNVLLQIMEDGHLTDGHGRTVNFRNTVIIMTSNLGTSSDAKGAFGFVTNRTESERDRDKLRSNVEDALRRFFPPEFLNRVDEVIIFEPLSQTELADIVELMLGEVGERLSDRNVSIEVTDAAKKALVEEGYDPAFGARPLRRVVERQIENALAKRILSGEFEEGEKIIVDFKDDAYDFEKADAAGSTSKAAAS